MIGQTVAQARKDPGTRRAFLEEIAGFAKLRGGRFVIFFDGDDVTGIRSPRGVQVRYSAPRSTDDEILQRLAEIRTPSEVIVVTNDRSLSARCRNAGARCMDWGNFLSRVQHGAHTRPSSGDAKDEDVNLDDWLRYFGMDKRNLR